MLGQWANTVFCFFLLYLLTRCHDSNCYQQKIFPKKFLLMVISTFDSFTKVCYDTASL